MSPSPTYLQGAPLPRRSRPVQGLCSALHRHTRCGPRRALRDPAASSVSRPERWGPRQLLAELHVRFASIDALQHLRSSETRLLRRRRRRIIAKGESQLPPWAPDEGAGLKNVWQQPAPLVDAAGRALRGLTGAWRAPRFDGWMELLWLSPSTVTLIIGWPPCEIPRFWK